MLRYMINVDVFIHNLNYVLLREVVHKYECRRTRAATLVWVYYFMSALQAKMYYNVVYNIMGLYHVIIYLVPILFFISLVIFWMKRSAQFEFRIFRSMYLLFEIYVQVDLVTQWNSYYLMSLEIKSIKNRQLWVGNKQISEHVHIRKLARFFSTNIFEMLSFCAF